MKSKKVLMWLLYYRKPKTYGIHLQVKLAKANKAWAVLTLSKTLYEQALISS